MNNFKEELDDINDKVHRLERQHKIFIRSLWVLLGVLILKMALLLILPDKFFSW